MLYRGPVRASAASLSPVQGVGAKSPLNHVRLLPAMHWMTNRRDFLSSATAALSAAMVPSLGYASVPSSYDWNAAPPTDSRDDYIAWMVKNRGEDPHFLGQRFDRFRDMVARHDVWEKRNIRAF